MAETTSHNQNKLIYRIRLWERLLRLSSDLRVGSSYEKLFYHHLYIYMSLLSSISSGQKLPEHQLHADPFSAFFRKLLGHVLVIKFAHIAFSAQNFHVKARTQATVITIILPRHPLLNFKSPILYEVA
jgi:hypothetical protein